MCIYISVLSSVDNDDDDDYQINPPENIKEGRKKDCHVHVIIDFYLIYFS